MVRGIHAGHTKAVATSGLKVKRDAKTLTTKQERKKARKISLTSIPAAGASPFENMHGIRRATLFRLLRKSGVIHASKTCCLPFRVVLYSFTKELARTSHVFAANAGRKTIKSEDVDSALRMLNFKFLGQDAGAPQS